MAKLLKLRGGTTSQHGSFTGAEREVTVDTDKETLVVHNGSQAGGFPLARADGTGTSNFTITGEIDAATLDISGDGDVAGTLNAGALTVDNFTINANEIDLSSGNLIVDVAGDIYLNGDGGQVFFQDGSTTYGLVSNENSGDFGLVSHGNNKDMIFRGQDNGSFFTALTLDMSEAGAAAFNAGITATTGTFSGAVSGTTGTFTGVVDADAGVTIDNITIDGTEIDLSSGDLTIDVAGDIILDADDGQVHIKDGGTEIGLFQNSSSDFLMEARVQDKDIKFGGNDGGSGITALTLDMSEAGAATFNNNVTAFSDERLKDNIETIDGGLAKVLSMRGVNYTRDGKDNIGVIAQEVEKVLPEIVLTADDEMGTKSVDYGRITAVLIEAIKELKTQIDAKCDCDCECKGE